MKLKLPKIRPPKLKGRTKFGRIFLVYLASIVGIALFIFGSFSIAYAGKIYPRVSVNDIMLGGLTPAEARTRLEQALAEQKLTPVILTVEDGRSFTIKPDEAAVGRAIDRSIEAAYAVGRDGDWLNSLAQKVTTPLFGYDLPAEITYDEPKLEESLGKIVDQITVTERSADLLIKNGVVEISPAKTGLSVDSKKLKQQVLAAFGRGESDPLIIEVTKKEPPIQAEQVEPVLQLAKQIINQPIILTYENQKFTASPSVLGGWLSTKVVSGLLGSKLELSFNEQKIDKYVAEIAAKIDLEPLDARLAVVGGNVVITQSSKDGLELKRDIAKADLIRLLTIRKETPLLSEESAPPSATPSPSPSPSPQADTTPAASPSIIVFTPTPNLAENQIALEVVVKKPDVTDANVNSLGIKERIAVSTTDFKGSPPNRQENIRVGTRLFNGIILAPGEQFSAVKSLGRIDESAGFKPELVIKQDQLTPEVGGGLCQVSTTLFRAVLNAGLKVDERRNHRFRVSYYEARPANPDPEDYVSISAKTLVGLDATIYDPSPDFKFSNDTPNHILIQGRVDGTRLTFELFGTNDGRKVNIEGPFITSSTAAPSEIQYIDDPTLPSGTTKIKERAVGGSKAYFNYSVTKDGKEIHKNSYGSSYVPWQAKYYRGTGPAAPPSPTPSPAPSPSASPEASPAAASPTPVASPATSPSPEATPAASPTPAA